MKIFNSNFGILGLARSGIAAAYKIKELGGNPFLSEFKQATEIENSEQLKKDFECEFGGHTNKILTCNIIIVSPGIPLDIPILKKAKEKNIKLLSEIEFGFQIKEKSSKIIAVTGSNGKSTTVSLIHHILQKAGCKSILAGNIGTAFTSFSIEKPGIDFIVLELSSFQLELIDKFRPDVAAVLNISPDHLNRYENMEEYAKTKFNIFKNQKNNHLAILNFDDEFTKKYQNNIIAEKKYFSLTTPKNIKFQNDALYFENASISLKNAILKGPHNITNIMATILAVSPYKISNKIIADSLKTFQPLPHRMEFVAKIDGVSFYNDSKATNTDSVQHALKSFQKPIRLILGGAGKGENYSILTNEIKRIVSKLYLIGEERFVMKKTFNNIVSLQLFDDFEKTIFTAFKDSKKGDNIILSPACTSFDMFKNFEDRGNAFKKIVRDLADEI